MLMLPLCLARIEDESDRQFMEDVYYDYSRLMYKIALEYVHTSMDADDIVNNACIGLCNNIAKLRSLERNGLTGYIVSSIRNTAINFRTVAKRNASRQTYVEDTKMKDIPSRDDDVETLVDRNIDIDELKALVRQLRGREKEVVEMMFYNAMETKEIALICGISEAGVRQTLKRARAHMKELKQNDEQEGTK